MADRGPDPTSPCPACGLPLTFLPAFPFLSALALTLSTIGPAEISPDDSGTWGCLNPRCIRHAAVLPGVPPGGRSRRLEDVRGIPARMPLPDRETAGDAAPRRRPAASAG